MGLWSLIGSSQVTCCTGLAWPGPLRLDNKPCLCLSVDVEPSPSSYIPFAFCFILSSQVDIMFFFCFHKVFGLFWVLKNKLDCQVLHFGYSHFPIKKQKVTGKLFFLHFCVVTNRIETKAHADACGIYARHDAFHVGPLIRGCVYVGLY